MRAIPIVLVYDLKSSPQPMIDSELMMLLMVEQASPRCAKYVTLKGTPIVSIAYEFKQLGTRAGRHRAYNRFIEAKTLNPKPFRIKAIQRS
jgi:hypothetical protein